MKILKLRCVDIALISHCPDESEMYISTRRMYFYNFLEAYLWHFRWLKPRRSRLVYQLKSPG